MHSGTASMVDVGEVTVDAEGRSSTVFIGRVGEVVVGLTPGGMTQEGIKE